MYVRTLGYVGVEVADLDAFRRFFGPLAGAELLDDDGGVVVRVDSWERRFLLTEGPADDVSFVGWEVADGAALDRMGERLSGSDPRALTADELAWRGVDAGFWCLDPDGVRTEIFYGPRQSSPFSAPLETVFVTGEIGLGHVVLSARDLEAASAFYEGLLGFRLSDTARLGGVDVRFLRCNPRHHSLALVGVEAPRRAQHLMLEVADLDSVGRAYDRFRAAEAAQTGIGRHSNDHMFSFYALSPAGFTLEYGWGGNLISGGPHVPSVFERESTWGHEELISTGAFG